ncbi:hypothetical protein P43SY_001945 [Pythium insidiosum]|uniref:Uncharacterized protein n=1 Tax=Pythium insidiosum TaxID=114742 RepID=A0AAD5LS74_PYTIN|nr:hypothetical protein P43SY_001945 [Pythium insidiosum]
MKIFATASAALLAASSVVAVVPERALQPSPRDPRFRPLPEGAGLPGPQGPFPGGRPEAVNGVPAIPGWSQGGFNVEAINSPALVGATNGANPEEDLPATATPAQGGVAAGNAAAPGATGSGEGVAAVEGQPTIMVLIPNLFGGSSSRSVDVGDVEKPTRSDGDGAKLAPEKSAASTPSSLRVTAAVGALSFVMAVMGGAATA